MDESFYSAFDHRPKDHSKYGNSKREDYQISHQKKITREPYCYYGLVRKLTIYMRDHIDRMVIDAPRKISISTRKVIIQIVMMIEINPGRVQNVITPGDPIPSLKQIKLSPRNLIGIWVNQNLIIESLLEADYL